LIEDIKIYLTLTDRRRHRNTTVAAAWDHTQNHPQLCKSAYLILLSAGSTDQISPSFISSQYMELK